MPRSIVSPSKFRVVQPPIHRFFLAESLSSAAH
jgi:hypothetical protein